MAGAWIATWPGGDASEAVELAGLEPATAGEGCH